MKEIAKASCKIWLEHGALDYKECLLEDAKKFDHCINFPTLAQA